MEWEVENGVKQIYCTYADTEVASLWVYVKCPYCNHEQKELDKTICGETYEIVCDECEKEYKMHFDHD